jgi:L-lactate utilization protein LutC
MNPAREAFLQRVRLAVATGNRAGTAPRLEPRGGVGYQGAGADPVAHFREELTAVGGSVHLVPNVVAAADAVVEIVQAKGARRVIIGPGTHVDPLGLPDRLRGLGLEVITPDVLTEETARDPLFAADLGITGVDYLIAETGSLVLKARPGEPRSGSLLPPVHVAVADRSQLLPDLFDLFEPATRLPRTALPSCVSIITGPSKTGDIELELVTGVHGPGEVHVVLLTG